MQNQRQHLMGLQTLRHIYAADGPFVTVHLEGRSPGEDAQEQVRLRWHQLRQEVVRDGADEMVVGHLDHALSPEAITEVQTDGRILVANASGVLLDERWDAALGTGDAAHWAAAPDLGPLLRERAQSVRLLLVIADKHGAMVQRLVAAPSHDLDQGTGEHVEGTGHGSGHRPRRGALSHKQIQRHAQEVVEQNQRDVADHLARVAEEWHPELVVLAGPVEARTALRNELPGSLTDSHVEIEAGGRDDQRGQEVLADRLGELAEEIGQGRARAATEQYEAAVAHGNTAAGIQDVMRAAHLRAVETVFLAYDRQVEEEPALLAAAALGDAAVAVVDAPITDDVAATLRFDLPEAE